LKEDESKMILTAVEIESVKKTHEAAAEELFNPSQQKANVVGMGIGIKWKNNIPTGEPALIILVTHKLHRNDLRSADLVPPRLMDMQTDVMAIGYPLAGGGEPAESSINSLTGRVRPIKGGFSVGNEKNTAGTIATSVYDTALKNGMPGKQENPSKYYILSNNHVLASSNMASIGDLIVQPSPYDGGRLPQDRVAVLSRFIPITFEPPVPRKQHHNLVDAAIAEGKFHDLDREIYWVGYVKGWKPRRQINVGERVQKTGRTTNYTISRIIAVNATVDISYGGGKVARFRDQIIATSFSASGDSGSLVTTMDNSAVGLLFAGSPSVTIINQIENVHTLLNVEIAGGKQ